MGRLIVTASRQKDLPLLEARRPHRRDRVPGRDAPGRPRVLAPQPAYPLLESRMTVIEEPALRRSPSRPATRRRSRAASGCGCSSARRRSSSGSCILGFWVVCAIFGTLIAPQDPQADDILNKLASPSADHLFGTDRLGRDVLSRVIVGAREILIMAPLATLLGTVARSGASASSPATTAASSTKSPCASSTRSSRVPVIILALLAITALGPSRRTLIIVIGIVFGMIIAQDGAGRGSQRARTRLRPGGAAPQRARARTSCSPRSSRT